MKIRTGKAHIYGLESIEDTKVNKDRDRLLIICDLILFGIMHSVSMDFNYILTITQNIEC